MSNISKLRQMTKELHDIANHCNDMEQGSWLRHVAALINNIADQLQRNELLEKETES